MTALRRSFAVGGGGVKPHGARKRKLIHKLAVRQGWRCIWCERMTSRENATLEHIVPKALGGSWHFRNLAMACARCNRARGFGMDERAFKLAHPQELQQAIARIKGMSTARRERILDHVRRQPGDPKARQLARLLLGEEAP